MAVRAAASGSTAASSLTGQVAVANGGTGNSTWPRFRVYRGTSNQTGVVSGASTPVVFNTATYDATTIVNVATGVATIPVAGVWHFDTAILITGALNAVTFGAVSFFKNGTIISTGPQTLAGNTAVTGLAASADILCAVSDTIDVRITVTTTASTATVNFAASGADTWFNGHWAAP